MIKHGIKRVKLRRQLSNEFELMERRDRVTRKDADKMTPKYAPPKSEVNHPESKEIALVKEESLS